MNEGNVGHQVISESGGTGLPNPNSCGRRRRKNEEKKD